VRILYLADAPYVHTVRVVRHFARLGHECEVFSFRPAEIEGARVTYVGGFERLGKARYLLQARRVRAMVQHRAPDVLHALHLTSYGFLGALSGYHPFVLSAWGTDILEAPRLSPFHGWLTRYSLRRADAVTATGPDLATQTARYAPPGRDVHVIPYGVDLGRFQPRARPEGENVVIGTAARLSPEKGLTYLLDAFALLKGRYGERVALRIAGDGPERGRLQEHARRLGFEVDWAGWLEHEALPAFLQSLDVFVLPSLHEGFGVAAVEASAMELPVVASRIDGIPDVVVDGRTGVLVPARDAGALAEAMGRLVEDASLRCEMGAAGRELVAQRYNWEKNAADLEALYARLAGVPAGSRP
jgi:glycosyltransferase involved in cell wall biosynthesis